MYLCGRPVERNKRGAVAHKGDYLFGSPSPTFSRAASPIVDAGKLRMPLSTS